jgi:hypothetical protein
LIVAINEATEEVKYFLSKATEVPLTRLLAVPFCHWTVEQGFRLGKQEAGGRMGLQLANNFVLSNILDGLSGDWR